MMLLPVFPISKIPFDSSSTLRLLPLLSIEWKGLGYCSHGYFTGPSDSSPSNIHCSTITFDGSYPSMHIFYIRTTIKMTADDYPRLSYDSVSTTDLTVGTTNTVTDTATVIDTSSCNPNDAFSQQLRIGRAVLWYLLLIYIKKSSVHPTIVPTSPWSVRFYFWFQSFLLYIMIKFNSSAAT